MSDLPSSDKMFLTAFKIRESDRKTVNCEHCGEKLHPLSAAIHMEIHIRNFLSTDEDDDDIDILTDESPSEEGNAMSIISEGENTAVNSDDQYNFNIHLLPPEILLHICKYLGLHDNLNLDCTLRGSFISNTGIKLHLKKKYEICINNSDESLQRMYLVIQRFICSQHRIFGEFNVRIPQLFIGENVMIQAFSELSNLYYDYKEQYLVTLKNRFLIESSLDTINLWICNKLN